MNDQIREQVSAFLDGELPAAERPLLMERLARDPALREHWSRYQLIGDSLRKSLPETIAPHLADRVMAEIDRLPALGRPGAALVRHVLKPLAGVAVAASVAAVAVLAVQQMRAPDIEPARLAAQSPAATAPVYARVDTLPDSRPAQVAARPGTDRLNEYLVNHSEYAASSGMPGMLPYVRIVGHDQD